MKTRAYREAQGVRSKPLGRRAGERGASRQAILAAARALFARRGFRATTMREIARRARVDVALVHYFFGTKPQLFAATVELPVDPEEVATLLTSGSGSPGERMARFYVGQLFVERREAVAAMLRAGIGDPDSVPTLRALIERTLVAAVAQRLPARDARLRAELAGAQMVGLFISRCVVGVEPLATASVDDIVTLLAPALDALLGVPDRTQKPAKGGSS